MTLRESTSDCRLLLFGIWSTRITMTSNSNHNISEDFEWTAGLLLSPPRTLY